MGSWSSGATRSSPAFPTQSSSPPPPAPAPSMASSSVPIFSSLAVVMSSLLEPSRDVRFMASFRFKLWWMAQKMGDNGRDIPHETLFLLLEPKDGSPLDDEETVCTVLLPLVEVPFRACLQGNPCDELELYLECGDASTRSATFSHALFIGIAVADPFAAISSAIATIKHYLKTFPLPTPPHPLPMPSALRSSVSSSPLSAAENQLSLTPSLPHLRSRGPQSHPFRSRPLKSSSPSPQLSLTSVGDPADQSSSHLFWIQQCTALAAPLHSLGDLPTAWLLHHIP